MISSTAGALLGQSQSRRFVSALNSDSCSDPLMGSSRGPVNSREILSWGKISSPILYHNDDILAVGIFKGCPEVFVSLSS